MSVGVATSQVDDTSVSKGVDRHQAALHRFGLLTTYGSVCAGREKWPFNVLFF